MQGRRLSPGYLQTAFTNNPFPNPVVPLLPVKRSRTFFFLSHCNFSFSQAIFNNFMLDHQYRGLCGEHPNVTNDHTAEIQLFSLAALFFQETWVVFPGFCYSSEKKGGR